MSLSFSGSGLKVISNRDRNRTGLSTGRLSIRRSLPYLPAGFSCHHVGNLTRSLTFFWYLSAPFDIAMKFLIISTNHGHNSQNKNHKKGYSLKGPDAYTRSIIPIPGPHVRERRELRDRDIAATIALASHSPVEHSVRVRRI